MLSRSEPHLDVALTTIEHVLEQDNEQAPYNRLIKHIKLKNSVVKYRYMTSTRALRMLEQGKLDCVFPVIQDEHFAKQNLLFSQAINGVSLHLFSLTKSYNNLAELNHKIVVHLRSYLFELEAKAYPEVHFYPVDNRQQMLTMLQQGRADAYLDYLPDLKFSLQQSDMQRLQYEPSSPVLAASDRFVCSNERAAKQFLAEVNTVLVELSRTGQLQQILGNYYQPLTRGQN